MDCLNPAKYIPPVSSCTDDGLGIRRKEANSMRAECKALPMKSKNGRWCGNRGRWAGHRLMPGFDCMSKVCCHRDCIQCSKALMAAHLLPPPLFTPPLFTPPLPVSFIYPPLLLCSRQKAHVRAPT